MSGAVLDEDYWEDLGRRAVKYGIDWDRVEGLRVLEYWDETVEPRRPMTFRCRRDPRGFVKIGTRDDGHPERNQHVVPWFVDDGASDGAYAEYIRYRDGDPTLEALPCRFASGAIGYRVERLVPMRLPGDACWREAGVPNWAPTRAEAWVWHACYLQSRGR